MTDLILERSFEKSLNPAAVGVLADKVGDCYGMHRVEWQSSFLSTDGHTMVCWFRAPDIESLRIALRQSKMQPGFIWSGTVHDGAGLGPAEFAAANVLVERRFDQPVTLQEIQDIEDEGSWCLENRDVQFARTYFSADRKRMICLYRGPDAESVRLAQRQAGVPFEKVWAFQLIDPAKVKL